MTLDETIRDVDKALRRLTLAGRYSLHTAEISNATGLNHEVVASALWLMLARGLCKRTASGGWRAGQPPPGGALGRMLKAVKNVIKEDDVTFGQLAGLARVERAKVRPLLEELVTKGHLRPTPDGWYEVT